MVYKYLICDLLSPVSDIVNKNLAITNRSCVSCAHNTSRAFRPNYPEIECVNFLRTTTCPSPLRIFHPLPSPSLQLEFCGCCKLFQWVRAERGWRGLVICELRTGNMRTNMRTRPLIGRDVTRVPRAVRKVPHVVHSSHCFVGRPNEPYCSIAESRCICIFMTTVFGQLFASVS